MRGPTGLALVGGRSRLITACANKVALVVNAASGAIMTSLPIEEGPDAVLVDAARGLAFVPCGKSGTLVELSILDRDHIAVVGTIVTQVSTLTGSIGPRNGRIYLPAPALGLLRQVTSTGRWSQAAFAVLVLASGT